MVKESTTGKDTQGSLSTLTCRLDPEYYLKPQMEAAKNGGGLLGKFSVFVGITNKECTEKNSDK
jgi:hypothetical protein